MPENGSKKYKESSHVYGKAFPFISLPNVMREYHNTELDFSFSFFITLKTE